MRLRRDSNAHKFLQYLAVASFLTIASLAAPMLPHQLLKGYLRRKRFERERFLRDLKNLQQRELVEIKELAGGAVKMTLTKQGKEKVLLYQLNEMRLDAKRPWDGKWRLIIFDIPDDFKKERDAFRKKLRELGFYALQESVFLTPYQCEDEIEFLAAFFGIRDHVLIMYVSHFEGQEKLKHRFKI